MDQSTATPARKKRTFVAEDFNANDWTSVEPYFKQLNDTPVQSLEELQQWLRNWSELDAVLSENSRWIYVRTTIDTTDEQAKADLINTYTNIYPHVSAWANVLSRKFIDNPYAQQLNGDVFFTTLRKMRKEIEMFREENIPLLSELNIKQSRFDEISSAQSIHYKGTELTFQQASVYLKSNNRTEREEVFKLVNERRMRDAGELDTLMTDLIKIRQRVAVNAGYENFVGYSFDQLGRFDYGPQDCLNFHKVVETVIMPLVNELNDERKKALGLEALRPWDSDVDTSGKAPLVPFKSSEELVEKTIACFKRLDAYFADCLAVMAKMKYLDLESRMHKGPGGYNMTMPEMGVPFIFMNSANTEHDLITMVHEGGHAVHTFLAHQLELNAFKEVTSEIAEVASMGMELMSMEHWDIFYPHPDDLKRARGNHMKYLLNVLTKTCLGDSFQFWMYTHPNHTVEERRKKWKELFLRYTPQVDWSGCEEFLETGYQRILHFYVVPFYYIEYAFAQLGALALWKNFKQAPAKAIADYKEALRLGFTKPIPVFYKTAGAEFNFSEGNVAALIDFLKQELKKLEA